MEVSIPFQFLLNFLHTTRKERHPSSCNHIIEKLSLQYGMFIFLDGGSSNISSECFRIPSCEFFDWSIKKSHFWWLLDFDGEISSSWEDSGYICYTLEDVWILILSIDSPVLIIVPFDIVVISKDSSRAEVVENIVFDEFLSRLTWSWHMQEK